MSVQGWRDGSTDKSTYYFLEDPSLIPRTNVRQLITARILVLKSPYSLLAPVRTPTSEEESYTDRHIEKI